MSTKVERLYVRAATLSCDNYTTYWSTSRHEWGSLSDAAVFTQEEIDSMQDAGKVGGQFVTADNGNGLTQIWVPDDTSGAFWCELPLGVKARSVTEISEQFMARADEPVDG